MNEATKRSVFLILTCSSVAVFTVSLMGSRGVGQINNPPVLAIASGMSAPSSPCNSQTLSSAYYQLPSTNQIWMCDGNNWNVVAGQTGAQGPAGTNGTNGNNGSTYLTGTTGVITGTLLAIGGFDSGTATVSGAATGTPCVASTTDGSNPSSSVVVSCIVTSTNTATVSLTALVLATPASKSYNVRVYP